MKEKSYSMYSTKKPSDENLKELCKWHQAENTAFDLALRVSNKGEGFTSQNTVLAQEWFSTVAQFLQVYKKTYYGSDSSAPEVFTRLAKIAESLALGLSPDPVQFAVADRDGGRPFWPGERRDISKAVFYVEAAKDGRIEDRKYNKTVQDNFGVTSQTVRNWLKNRNYICEGEFPHEPKDLFINMKRAGQNFRKHRTGRKPKKSS